MQRGRVGWRLPECLARDNVTSLQRLQGKRSAGWGLLKGSDRDQDREHAGRAKMKSSWHTIRHDGTWQEKNRNSSSKTFQQWIPERDVILQPSPVQSTSQSSCSKARAEKDFRRPPGGFMDPSLSPPYWRPSPYPHIAYFLGRKTEGKEIWESEHLICLKIKIYLKAIQILSSNFTGSNFIFTTLSTPSPQPSHFCTGKDHMRTISLNY